MNCSWNGIELNSLQFNKACARNTFSVFPPTLAQSLHIWCVSSSRSWERSAHLSWSAWAQYLPYFPKHTQLFHLRLKWSVWWRNQPALYIYNLIFVDDKLSISSRACACSSEHFFYLLINNCIEQIKSKLIIILCNIWTKHKLSTSPLFLRNQP